MALSFKNKQNTNSISADVVEGYLILSLLTAQEPKIWRMELEKIGTASFEINQEKDSAITKLILKPKKGTAEIIASFNTQEEALEALTLAANALQHKESPTNISTKPRVSEKTKNVEGPAKPSKWIIILLGFIIIVGLYYYLNTLIPDKNIGFEQAASSQQNTSSPQETTGVPVSADDFLNGL